MRNDIFGFFKYVGFKDIYIYGGEGTGIERGSLGVGRRGNRMILEVLSL